MDPDRARGIHQIGKLAELASGLGLATTTLELPPTSAVGGVAALEELRLPNLRLLIDSMHFFRSGSRIEDLAALDPDLIGCAVIRRAPGSDNPDYMDEAMFGRPPPSRLAAGMR